MSVLLAEKGLQKCLAIGVTENHFTTFDHIAVRI